MGMSRTNRSIAAVLLAVGLAAAACGGAPSAGSPADAVREAFRLVDEGNLEGVVAVTCEAQKATIRQQFTFSDLAGRLPGVDLTEFFKALRLDASKLTITETSRQSDTATVQLAGTLVFSFEAERLRDIFRKLAEQQGQAVDDATLNRLLIALEGTVQSLPIDQSLPVAREGGSWKLCGRLTLIG
jgi:hypothetical protein